MRLYLFCLAAGLGDALTGLLLLVAPGWAYAQLGLGPLPDPPAYASFVGAFVMAVGLAYLYPWLLPAETRVARLRTVLEVTALSRLAVAGFLAVALTRGSLGTSFALVLATDLCLGLGQLAFLAWRPRR